MLLRFILAGVALAGGVFSGVLGVASYLFHRGDRASIELAARLVPFDPVYLARLSSYHPDERTDLLRRAVTLNPYSEQAWLQVGFDAEFHHHDRESAEKYYLHAAEVSRLFLSRWTLTNFYYRQQNKPAFLRWAKQALATTPYAAYPVFTELWLFDQDHASIASAIPDRPAILNQYVSFLLNVQQYGSIPGVVERLAAAAPAAAAESFGLNNVLADALDRLISAGYVPEALQSWKALSAAHWIPFGTPDASRPVTNASFRRLYGHGFDWIPISNPGVAASQPPKSQGISIELSGNQPESCELLSQWIPVGGGKRYSLKWDASSIGLPTPAGLTWHLRAGDVHLQSDDLLETADRKWQFETAPGMAIALLTLEYRRPIGQSRADGTLQLRRVEATRAD